MWSLRSWMLASIAGCGLSLSSQLLYAQTTPSTEEQALRQRVEDLERKHPGIRERLCDEQGRVRRFVNIYVNGDDIRFLSSLETPVKDGDEVSIVPAIAGG